MLPLSKGKSLLSEFKNFAFKGNVIDLAVGVIIGAAFGNIIQSLVKNVIMPLISYITPNTDFSAWKWGKVNIGLLMNDILSFIIVAIALFIFIVKFLGWLMRAKQEEAAEPPPPPPPTREQELLAEIRDLLKAQTAGGTSGR